MTATNLSKKASSVLTRLPKFLGDRLARAGFRPPIRVPGTPFALRIWLCPRGLRLVFRESSMRSMQSYWSAEGWCAARDDGHYGCWEPLDRGRNWRHRRPGPAVEELLLAAAQRRCRVCGCTQQDACDEGCSWVEADLCSACARD